MGSHNLTHRGFEDAHRFCRFCFIRVEDLELKDLLLFEEVFDLDWLPVRIHVIFDRFSAANLFPFLALLVILSYDAHRVGFADNFQIFESTS